MTKEVSCRDAGYDDCEFLIRSENEVELIDFVRQHSRDTHDASVSTADVRGVMRDA